MACAQESDETKRGEAVGIYNAAMNNNSSNKCDGQAQLEKRFFSKGLHDILKLDTRRPTLPKSDAQMRPEKQASITTERVTIPMIALHD